MNTNKKYKDTVFTRYFSDEKKLRLLYNALEHTNYGEETEINIITLEDILFMNQKNDICFTIDNKFILLLEHPYWGKRWLHAFGSVHRRKPCGQPFFVAACSYRNDHRLLYCFG